MKEGRESGNITKTMNEHDKDKKWKQKDPEAGRTSGITLTLVQRTKMKLTYLDTPEKDQKVDIKRSQQTLKNGIRKYPGKSHKNENTVKVDLPLWTT